MNSSSKISGTSLSRSGAVVTHAERETNRAVLAQRHADRNAERKAAKAARKKPCVHRGKRTSGADTYGPKGVSCCKLYECKLFQLCAVVRVLPGIATCANCPEYESASKRQPDADDGRAG